MELRHGTPEGGYINGSGIAVERVHVAGVVHITVTREEYERNALAAAFVDALERMEDAAHVERRLRGKSV